MKDEPKNWRNKKNPLKNKKPNQVKEKIETVQGWKAEIEKIKKTS